MDERSVTPYPTRMRNLSLAAAALVVAAAAAGAQAPSTLGLQKDPRIAAALADISPARLRTMDSMLVSFGTRNTLSDTLSSTRGIGAARRWIHAQLTQASKDCGGCLRVEYDTGTATVASFSFKNAFTALATPSPPRSKDMSPASPR